jgi:hypothetical protein
MTAIEFEQVSGLSDALEEQARLTAAARGDDLEALVIAFLRDYVNGARE